MDPSDVDDQQSHQSHQSYESHQSHQSHQSHRPHQTLGSLPPSNHSLEGRNMEGGQWLAGENPGYTPELPPPFTRRSGNTTEGVYKQPQEDGSAQYGQPEGLSDPYKEHLAQMIIAPRPSLTGSQRRSQAQPFAGQQRLAYAAQQAQEYVEPAPVNVGNAYEVSQPQVDEPPLTYAETYSAIVRGSVTSAPVVEPVQYHGDVEQPDLPPKRPPSVGAGDYQNKHSGIVTVGNRICAFISVCCCCHCLCCCFLFLVLALHLIMFGAFYGAKENRLDDVQ